MKSTLIQDHTYRLLYYILTTAVLDIIRYVRSVYLITRYVMLYILSNSLYSTAARLNDGLTLVFNDWDRGKLIDAALTLAAVVAASAGNSHVPSFDSPIRTPAILYDPVVRTKSNDEYLREKKMRQKC